MDYLAGPTVSWRRRRQRHYYAKEVCPLPGRLRFVTTRRRLARWSARSVVGETALSRPSQFNQSARSRRGVRIGPGFLANSGFTFALKIPRPERPGTRDGAWNCLPPRDRTAGRAEYSWSPKRARMLAEYNRMTSHLTRFVLRERHDLRRVWWACRW